MKNVALVFFILLFMGCQEKKAPKSFYAIDGTEHNSIESRIEHEARIREIRSIRIDINVVKGHITEWERDLIKSKYRTCDDLIELYRSSNLDFYKINREYNDKDTFRAYNREVFYDKTVRDFFNQDLNTLDSLNTIIGLQEYNTLK